MIDIVYILGTGSVSNDDEIRYSLRSLEQYCTDMGRVFIVGCKPDFLDNVTHVLHNDTHIKPWRNTLDKVRAVCNREDVSEDFLLMNDDFFAFDYFSAEELPFYATKKMDGGVNGPVSFSVHRPIRLNKHLYRNMPISSSDKIDYSPRSFYGNFFKVPPAFCSDIILRMGDRMPPLDKQIGKEPFASIDDVTMLHPEFRSWMQKHFPRSSRYEIA